MDVQERVVSLRPRTILVVLGVTLLFVGVLALVYLAWHVITWILIAVFLAAALNPAVEFLQRRGMGRGIASGLVFLAALRARLNAVKGARTTRQLSCRSASLRSAA